MQTGQTLEGNLFMFSSRAMLGQLLKASYGKPVLVRGVFNIFFHGRLKMI